MKKVSLDVWIQLLGMLGVLGGLVFVGLEMQQSQRIAMANTYQDRISTTMSFITAYAETNLDWWSAISYSLEEAEELSDLEIAERNAHNGLWSIYESDFVQYTQGLMTEDAWQAKLRGIELFLANSPCHLQEIFETRIATVEEGFREIVRGFPRNCGVN